MSSLTAKVIFVDCGGVGSVAPKNVVVFETVIVFPAMSLTLFITVCYDATCGDEYPSFLVVAKADAAPDGFG